MRIAYANASLEGGNFSRVSVDSDDNVWLLVNAATNQKGFHLLEFGPDLVATDWLRSPTAISLGQNHPNPVSAGASLTTIRFSLPSAQHVAVRLYDLVGRELGIVAEGRFSEGEHEASISTQGLKSGVYVYRLITEQESVNRLLTVIK